ncbi:MAG: NlpC/P60 family protein [Cyanobacteriota bacterium]|nr:NlpC/P60 family protein [Cyanobacteriota bacterium]
MAAPELLRPGTIWQLLGPLQGYSRSQGFGLATQAWTGRQLQVLESPAGASRLRVRLLEDGYPCWVEPADLLGLAQAAPRRQPQLLSADAIAQRLPVVLAFADAARQQPNRYLWGGSLGPDYDCSGLVQRAFAEAGVWIPRDAYLQERFCQPVAVAASVLHALRPGDLIFFGPAQRCTHVALHLGGGRYLHSSGQEHGHDGLAIDTLAPHNQDPVACHYRRQLRGAGRVVRCHDGSPLPA